MACLALWLTRQPSQTSSVRNMRFNALWGQCDKSGFLKGKKLISLNRIYVYLELANEVIDYQWESRAVYCRIYINRCLLVFFKHSSTWRGRMLDQNLNALMKFFWTPLRSLSKVFSVLIEKKLHCSRDFIMRNFDRSRSDTVFFYANALFDRSKGFGEESKRLFFSVAKISGDRLLKRKSMKIKFMWLN